MWEKVSNDKGAYYKDICNEPTSSNSPEDIYNRRKPLKKPKLKNDAESVKYREEGNKLFKERKLEKAMELYNQSICYAEISQSELVGLAMGNRSACFFEMKRYVRSLIDTDMVEKCKYPEHLTHKLKKRKDECAEIIVKGDQGMPFLPKLSFRPHLKFPFMANVLNITRNEQFGLHIITTEDLAVAQIVVVEKNFMTAHRYEKYILCNGCMKKNVNLSPCCKCPEAMFCSKVCASNFHSIECGMQSMPDEFCNDNQMHVIRSILQALFIFETIEEIQTFVESAISSDPLEIPESLFNGKSRYRAFLKLWYEPNAHKRKGFGQQVYSAYKTLLEHPLVGPQFNTIKKKRFLMHLVAQHVCIINYSGNIVFDNYPDSVGWDLSEYRSVIASYVNHSCTPNVTLVSSEGHNILITIRPVKKGGQLFLTYFRNDKMDHTTEDRKKYLLSRVKFCCKCQRCEDESPPMNERIAMQSDECYDYINLNKAKIMHGVAEDMKKTADVLEDKCIEFLNKYGQSIWCREIEIVVDCYRRLVAAAFHNKIRF